MDEPEELECQSCDFRFSVIWQMNAEIYHGTKDGEAVILYCPHCGEELNDDWVA